MFLQVAQCLSVGLHLIFITNKATDYFFRLKLYNTPKCYMFKMCTWSH